jgi:predicted ATPase
MISNDRIVLEPTKIDLHIHSTASRHKDGAKVQDGTVENIRVLLEKLEENKVNMAAITDHDVFSYEMYAALRDKVSNARYLKRVLPGVEFTVSFNNGNSDIPVHVVTLFDDADQEKVKSIGTLIPVDDKGKPKYDINGTAFSEDMFWRIIRSIGLDIVTIAHQKNSPNSNHKPKKDDANSVGSELYDGFLSLEYFEAYEYKNRKNELYNKAFAHSYSRDQLEQLRFITGSDCHVWSVYPAGDDKNDTNSDLPFTYLKCLPTFKGLAMAVTDISRIKVIDSFFSRSTKTLDSISLILNGEDVGVPLSPGINALIGDNSIGKSSLLNALTDFRGVNPTTAKGQRKYLKESHLALRQVADESFILQFDGQNAIRNTFENLSQGKAQKELDKHFPASLDPSVYKTFALNQLKRYLSALRKSCEYQAALKELTEYSIPREAPLLKPQSITFSGRAKAEDASSQQQLIDKVKEVQTVIQGIDDQYHAIIVEEDVNDFDTVREALSRISTRHQATARAMELEAKVINSVNSTVNSCEHEQRKVVIDAQKEQSDFTKKTNDISHNVAHAVEAEHGVVSDFKFDFETMRITPRVNPVGELRFVCTLATEEVTPQLLDELVESVTAKGKTPSTKNSSYESLRDAILRYPDDIEDPIDALEGKLEDALDKKLSSKRMINRAKDNDVSKELSSGYNAQMYFALMADTSMGDGVYMVDQPEDQISQKAIKDVVLKDFRDIAGARQVILITHNPQFIVNLDVDNVIYLGKHKDGTLYLQSGALEYECSDYRMLDTVAENIEGGLDTIRRRMKRYDQAGLQS